MRVKTNTICFVAILALVAWACNRNPYKATNKVYSRQAKMYAKEMSSRPAGVATGFAPPQYWTGTTNFNLRKPNFVIIHHTAQNSCAQTLTTFTLPRTQVSAHYVICKDGTVHHMLHDYLRAWHGGLAKWGNLTDINSASIGIEIDNNGFESFTPQQLPACCPCSIRLKSDTLYRWPTLSVMPILHPAAK